MALTAQQAKAWLNEAAGMNPGPWVEHSRFVAEAARIIAQHTPGMDGERAYSLGLLHDIGRRFGVTGNLHIADGYDYMMGQGCPEAAKVCLTHSFPLQDIESCFGSWDAVPGRDGRGVKERVRRLLAQTRYDGYDQLVQLCDALALPTGFCLLEKRWVDVVMRHGPNPLMAPKWRATYRIKELFEKQMGSSIYELLPGVIENTFA
jgi:hypothetical protein